MERALRLPRGAALAAEHAAELRSFAIGFWFPLGSRHEAAHERGFVHFVEHMAFKGTERRSASLISREIDRVGGYLNAFTDRDSICLHCQVPAAQWRLAIDVLADMTFFSRFLAEDFERERDVIVSEIMAALDDPEESAHDELLGAIWPGDPLSRTIAGQPRDLAAATREALYSFYLSAFEPDALLVTAAGPVAPNDVAEELGRVLAGSSFNDRPVSPPRRQTTPRFQPVRQYRKASMGQVNYFEAIQLEPPFGFADYYAMAALNGLVGEAASSRLFQSLREERGLCYSVYSGFSMGKTECLWLSSANASLSRLPQLAGEMARVLDGLAESPLGEEECADARERLLGSFELALDDADYRMRRLARQILFSDGYLGIEESHRLIAGLDLEDVDGARKRLFAGTQRARFAYGRRSPAAAAAVGLESVDGPSGESDA